MGTHSKWFGFGVVAMTLGLAACGGKYDVGSGETGGQAGEGGAGDGAGGKAGSSTSGSSSGGSAGGDAGVAGSSAGGASGSSTGGVAGSDGCVQPPGELPAFEAAAPDVVWERLSRFFHGDPVEPFGLLPEETTTDWVREMVLMILDERFSVDGRAPAGLERYLNQWAFGGEGEESAQYWGQVFAHPARNFSLLFSPAGDRVSFLSDEAFLVAQQPIRRGTWMLENLFCLPMPLPPIEIEPVTVPPNMTRRQVVEGSVADPSCAGCHRLLDPLAFSLEHYDGMGVYRTHENGIPIDASGTFNSDYASMTFASIDDLAPQLDGSCEVRQCFARNLFLHALAQARPSDSIAYTEQEVEYVQYEFRFHFQSIGPLLQAIVTTPAFLSE